jgi:transposase
MKTAVLGEVDVQGIAYNRKLLDLGAHYRFLPKACRPYRAKTKGKVERPFRYVREHFMSRQDDIDSAMLRLGPPQKKDRSGLRETLRQRSN